MAKIFPLITAIGIFLAVLGSISSIGACAWVTVSGSLASSNFGLWRVNDRSAGNNCTLFCCDPYPRSFNADSNLAMARAGSILAPLLGVFAAILGFLPSLSFRLVSLLLAVMASIFQGTTLLIRHSNVCARIQDETDAYCTINVFSWAYWVSLYATLFYVASAVVATIHFIVSQEQNSGTTTSTGNSGGGPQQFTSGTPSAIPNDGTGLPHEQKTVTVTTTTVDAETGQTVVTKTITTQQQP